MEPGDGDVGRAVEVHSTPVDHHGARAQEVDGVHVVADEHDGGARALKFAHPVEAPELEGDVAHRQHLVDDQDVGDHVDGDGEARVA